MRMVPWAPFILSQTNGDLMLGVHDLSILIHPYDVKRNFRVFHPKGPIIKVGKGKEHAAVWGKRTAEHEPLTSFLGGIGYFREYDESLRCHDRGEACS